ncbi:unnamed protein product [Urochloa decumbens]|uniref:F-box domain-containing protein n=1 Tax=Urochloa decumbens TaxID=240449 RepID=A0ABC9CJW7_9POAL
MGMERGKPSTHVPAKASSHGTVDRISKLPDDIMLTIFERLDICDAVRTSIVTKQWRHMPTMLNKLIIKVSSFEPDKDNRSKISLNDLDRANATMLEATKSILSRRNASQYPLHLLCLQFYLGDESIAIAKTVAYIMETQTVGSVELIIMTKKDHAHCTEDDVTFHGRQLMSLFEACPNAFAVLTCLKLENLSLNESDLPNIFCVCKKLEFLRLYNCDMGILSSLDVEHPRLGELEMDQCRFERVNLKWLPMLTMLTFEDWISQKDPLSFGYVPLLRNVSLNNIAFSWHKTLELSELLCNSRVNTLELNFMSEKIWIRPECARRLLPVFCRLRRVNLINVSEECDLNWTMFILQGAPSLEELHILVRDHLCQMLRNEELRREYEYSEKKGVDWEGAQLNFKHHKLTVLKIFGFRPDDKFVRYVRKVIEAAVNLQDIFLKQRFSLRNRITDGTNSFAVIHFPSF